jgi:hypothetical protein
LAFSGPTANGWNVGLLNVSFPQFLAETRQSGFGPYPALRLCALISAMEQGFPNT